MSSCQDPRHCQHVSPLSSTFLHFCPTARAPEGNNLRTGNKRWHFRLASCGVRGDKKTRYRQTARHETATKWRRQVIRKWITGLDERGKKEKMGLKWNFHLLKSLPFPVGVFVLKRKSPDKFKVEKGEVGDDIYIYSSLLHPYTSPDPHTRTSCMSEGIHMRPLTYEQSVSSQECMLFLVTWLHSPFDLCGSFTLEAKSLFKVMIMEASRSCFMGTHKDITHRPNTHTHTRTATLARTQHPPTQGTCVRSEGKADVTQGVNLDLAPLTLLCLK